MNQEVDTLHVPFLRHLREQGIEYIYARPDKESSIAKGWPDVTVLSPTSAPLCIEFKDKETGKVTPDQKTVHDRLKSKGFLVFVVRDLATAIELVTAWREFGPKIGEAQQATKELGIHIRNVPGYGDWVFSNNMRIRQATISDLATIERRNA